ncbi:RecB family exonuclease [Actinoalloteichus fjordicus]|uniref:RecB family exonuclease n=2 Tax=Pseudonocardiaceae TaxID=2070 RepID=A0AAC9L8Z0_9PSEU|nr:RecB family exonuclease [Actinoalloteichus fjordicus]
MQLGLEGMPSRLVRVTPARLARWADCPRRYRLTYLDRPAPARGGAWAHSTLGAVVHNALRAIFAMPGRGRTLAAASAEIRRHWKSDGFRDAAQAADYRERAENWVSDYVEDADPDLEPVALERWVSASAGTIVAEGRVDRIDARGGELVVVDYKTGRHGVTVDDARDSQALALYALAARRTLRRPCRRVELHHLPTGSVQSWEHDESSMDEHLNRASATAEQLQSASDDLSAGGDADRLFPTRAGRRCSWCEFRNSCADGRAAAPPLDSWALLRP